MYYDLVASLPYLPHFERADRVPITPLRLEQRLRRLRPLHAAQLQHVRPVIRWRPERLIAQSDRSIAVAYATLARLELVAPLRQYVQFRITQQTLLAALRRKQDGLDLPDDSPDQGTRVVATGPLVYTLRRNWDKPYFGLQFRFPWLPPAAAKLAATDAIGLERLLMDLHWRWLTQTAEQAMFGFEAVVAFVFKWDMLRAWSDGDPQQAKVRFTQLIDKVTDVEGA